MKRTGAQRRRGAASAPARRGTIVDNGPHRDDPDRGASTKRTRAWDPPSFAGALTIGAAGVLLVTLLGVTIHALGNGPLPVDSWWHDLMVALRTNVGLTIARVLQAVGGTIGVIVAGVVMIIWFAALRRPRSVLTVVLVFIVAQLLTNGAKVVFARPRPADSLGATAATSFPSGHTSMAAAIGILLALLLGTRLVWILAAAWIVLMAWSRTYLAAHWLTDVTGGAILGASTALIIWAAVHSLGRGAGRPTPPSPSGAASGSEVTGADESPSA